MSKHTPGPWYVAPSLNEIVNADHGFLRYDIRADYLLIGALYENKADARLIEAAPDLLAFVEEFLDAWEDGMASDSFMRRKAERLLKLATGGSND